MLRDRPPPSHARLPSSDVRRSVRHARKALPAGLVAAGAVVASLAGVVLWLHLLAGPLRLATGLTSASDHLDKANNRLTKGDTGDAKFEVLAGSAGAERARDALEGRSPLLDILAAAPKVGPIFDEVDHLVAASEYSAGAARSTLDIVDGALEGPNSIIQREGKGSSIRVDRVVAIGDEVEAVREEIRAARSELSAIDLDNLPRRADRSVAEALRKADEAEDALIDAKAAFAVLPSILGADEPRTYLIGFQNTAEARGTGGAILQFETINIDDGDVKLGGGGGSIYNVDENRQQLDIPLPEGAWVQQTIPDTRRFGNANWSPHFPLATELFLGYARASAPDFPDVDGVIAVAPQAMADILPAIGKLKIKDDTLEEKLTLQANDIVRFVLNEQYGLYPFPTHRRTQLKKLVASFYTKLFNPKKPFALLEGMSDSLAGKHMQIWMRDPAEQKFIERMDWDGALDSKKHSDYLLIVEENVGGNKLDYFDAQENDVDITLEGDDAVTSARIAITNRVRLPQARWVMGDSGEEIPPLHRPMVLVYTRPDSQLVGASVEGTRVDAPPPAVWSGGVTPPSYEEAGKKAWPVTMEALPGETVAADLDYRVPGVVRTVDGRRVYRLTVQHQPKVRPEWLRIALHLPQGASEIRTEGWKRSSEGLEWEGPMTRDMILEVSWRD